MTSVEHRDWYVLKGRDTVGPMTAGELALLTFSKHVDGRDLVWCKGMASWMPLGSALAVDEGQAAAQMVDDDDPEFTVSGILGTAQKVKSLSKLYRDSLVGMGLPPPPRVVRREPTVRLSAEPQRPAGIATSFKEEVKVRPADGTLSSLSQDLATIFRDVSNCMEPDGQGFAPFSIVKRGSITRRWAEGPGEPAVRPGG